MICSYSSEEYLFLVYESIVMFYKKLLRKNHLTLLYSNIHCNKEASI